MTGERPLRVGCRGTNYCRAQTTAVLERVQQLIPDLRYEITDVTDATAPADAIVDATGAGVCDIHVCGAREVPLDLPEDVAIIACTERRDPFDVLVSKDGELVEDLPDGAVVAVDSSRVAVQLLAFREDLDVKKVAGPADKMLELLNAGEVAAFIVAAEEASVLGWEHAVAEVFPPDIILSAAGQGSFAFLARCSDEATAKRLAGVDHVISRQVIQAERAFLRELGARITDPVAVQGAFEGDTLVMTGLLADEVSGAILRDELDGKPEEEADFGIRLAKLFVAEGAKDYLAGYR